MVRWDGVAEMVLGRSVGLGRWLRLSRKPLVSLSYQVGGGDKEHRERAPCNLLLFLSIRNSLPRRSRPSFIGTSPQPTKYDFESVWGRMWPDLDRWRRGPTVDRLLSDGTLPRGKIGVDCPTCTLSDFSNFLGCHWEAILQPSRLHGRAHSLGWTGGHLDGEDPPTEEDLLIDRDTPTISAYDFGR